MNLINFIHPRIFTYIRDAVCFPVDDSGAAVPLSRITVAWRPGPESGTISVGIAWCSPRDQFIRARGRLIAGGRLGVNSQVIDLVMDDGKLTVRNVLRSIRRAVRNGELLAPSWAARALKRDFVLAP